MLRETIQFWFICFISQEPYTIMLSAISSLASSSSWHQHQRHLFAPLLATGLNIKLHIYLCSSCMHIKFLVILVVVVFKQQPFWYFPFICYPVLVDSHWDFIFFTYIHKRSNATVTYFLKFMNMYILLFI